MSRPLHAVVDPAALHHNLGVARRLAPESRLLAIVKADGYGHGAARVARVLAGEVDGFGVASLEEAVTLRDAGIDGRIVLLAGVFGADELAEAAHHRLDLVIHHHRQLEWLRAHRGEPGVRVWLKLDSGMHRLGFEDATFRTAWTELGEIAAVRERILMSHLARADEPASESTLQQLERFLRVIDGLEAPRSLANSAAVLAWPETHLEWVRPGLMLYGVSPMVESHPEAQALRPAMRLVSEIVAVRSVPAGEAIGYGGRHVCRRASRIGVVACGYGDGYPVQTPDGTPVLVGGRRAPLAGRVSMDLMTVDLSELPDAGVGTPVELWGPGLPVREVAHEAGTIHYELMSGVTARVPRRRPEEQGS